MIFTHNISVTHTIFMCLKYLISSEKFQPVMKINGISDQHGYITIESRHVIRASHLTEHKSNIYNICHPLFYLLFLDESIVAKRIDFETALLHE